MLLPWYKDVYVGIRPEGFFFFFYGELGCTLKNVEIMGRDMSIVSENKNCHNATVRSIIPSDSDISGISQNVRFDIKDNKIFVFDKLTEELIEDTALNVEFPTTSVSKEITDFKLIFLFSSDKSFDLDFALLEKSEKMLNQ